jgi:hypothetical protein
MNFSREVNTHFFHAAVLPHTPVSKSHHEDQPNRQSGIVSTIARIFTKDEIVSVAGFIQRNCCGHSESVSNVVATATNLPGQSAAGILGTDPSGQHTGGQNRLLSSSGGERKL